MKKVLFATALMIGMISSSFAQTAKPKESKQKMHKTAVATKDGEQSKVKENAATAKTATPGHMTAATTTKTKKDGTPDKRVKTK